MMKTLLTGRPLLITMNVVIVVVLSVQHLMYPVDWSPLAWIMVGMALSMIGEMLFRKQLQRRYEADLYEITKKYLNQLSRESARAAGDHEKAK